MKLRVWTVEIDEPSEHVIGAVLQDLFDRLMGDGAAEAEAQAQRGEAQPEPGTPAPIAAEDIAPGSAAAAWDVGDSVSRAARCEATPTQRETVSVPRETDPQTPPHPLTPSPSVAEEAPAGRIVLPPPRSPAGVPRPLPSAASGSGNPRPERVVVNASQLDDEQSEALRKAINGRHKPGSARHLDAVMPGGRTIGVPAGRGRGRGIPTAAPAPKPGVLATPEQQAHFENHHGSVAKAREPRVVAPGHVAAYLRTMRTGEEIIIQPAPTKLTGIAAQIHAARRAGQIGKGVAVTRDTEGVVRVTYHEPVGQVK